jgi:hypothetical protein
VTVTPILVAASGDDAHYGYEGPAHPRTTSDALNTSDTIGVLQRNSFSSSTYRIIHGFLRFDTSIIPTDATINSITLQVYINATRSANSPNWVGALYD